MSPASDGGTIMADITIIIPVYNCEETVLRRCLDSLCALGEEAEILIVDDGSTDQTPATLKEYDNKYSFVHVFTQVNTGVSGARNAGLERATGRWVLFSDADDVSDARAIRSAISRMDRENADYGFGDFQKIIGEKTEIMELEDPTSSKELLRMMLCQPNRYGAVWGKVFRREFLEENHLRFDTSLSHAEDTEFLVRVLARADKVCHLTDAWYHYYVYPSSAAKINREALDHFEKSLEVIQSDVAGENLEIRKAFHNCVNINLLIMMVNYVFRPGVSFREGKPVLEELLNKPLFRDALSDYDERSMGKANRAALSALRSGALHAAYLAAKARQARG